MTSEGRPDDQQKACEPPPENELDLQRRGYSDRHRGAKLSPPHQVERDRPRSSFVPSAIHN